MEPVVHQHNLERSSAELVKELSESASPTHVEPVSCDGHPGTAPPELSVSSLRGFPYDHIRDPFSNWHKLHDGIVLKKAYKTPGYDVKQHYRTKVAVGLILSLLLMISLFRAPLYQEEITFDMPAVQETVQIEEIRQTRQEFRPPPPPRPPVPVEVPNDMILEDTDLNLDATLDIDETPAVLPPPPAPVVPEIEEELVEENEEQEIFVVVEEMPELIGGMAAVYEHLVYPAMARHAGLEGLVVINIVIESDGTPSNFEVVRSPHAILSDAALEAARHVHFKPGKQRGKPVRVRYALPVRFRLNK